MQINFTLLYLSLGCLMLYCTAMNLTLPENFYDPEKHGLTFHWEAINRTDGQSEMVFFINASKKLEGVMIGWGLSQFDADGVVTQKHTDIDDATCATMPTCKDGLAIILVDIKTNGMSKAKIDDSQDYTLIEYDYVSDPDYNYVKWSRLFDTGDD